VQVAADVDLDELWQPRRLPDSGEQLDEALVLAVSEVDDAPYVQRRLFGAANAVLDVEPRLQLGGAQSWTAGILKYRVTCERHNLSLVVQVGAFEDQAVLLATQPQPPLGIALEDVHALVRRGPGPFPF
jgi:hypothetical protein